MNRRGVLKGLAGIFAAGVAPAVIPSGVLMPVRKLVLPKDDLVFYDDVVVVEERIRRDGRVAYVLERLMLKPRSEGWSTLAAAGFKAGNNSVKHVIFSPSGFSLLRLTEREDKEHGVVTFEARFGSRDLRA